MPAVKRRGFAAVTASLSTCDVSDALDELGLKGAPHGLRPLWPGCRKIAGRAATMKLVRRREASPVTGTLEAIQAARSGDVLVIDHGGRTDVNSFGGIAAFTASRRGLAGIVIDGVTRDVDEIAALGFPAYGRGVIQQSIRNRCGFGGHGIEIRLGGVRVRPGDLIMADDNGVVVVPWERIEEVLEIARRRVRAEQGLRRRIARGEDPSRAHRLARYEPGQTRSRA